MGAFGDEFVVLVDTGCEAEVAVGVVVDSPRSFYSKIGKDGSVGSV